VRIPECLKRLAVMIALCCSAPPALAEARPSNIVLIIADDLGVGDVRYLRSGPFATPNLDRLSRESTLFTNAYVTAAVCSPSRAGLHTGRYQARFGHDFNPGRAPATGRLLHRSGWKVAFRGTSRRCVTAGTRL
jgi:arylsulfatase A-like enzyme